MPMTIVKPEELDSYIGKSLEPSEWLTIDQERINKFADATMDQQFIHVDSEQATPVFGSTIAHGFLSLSLVAGIPFEQDIGMVPCQCLVQKVFQQLKKVIKIHERWLIRILELLAQNLHE